MQRLAPDAIPGESLSTSDTGTAMNHELLEKLPKESLLKVLDQTELAELLVHAREAKARKGEAIIRQGDDGNALIILLEGQARITVYSANGREIVLEYAGAGTVLGEIALLDGGVRTASVIAMGPLKYLILPRSAFEQTMASNHRIALRIMKELASRLRKTNQTIETDRAPMPPRPASRASCCASPATRRRRRAR
jgi:CRP/FNR family transcriptional regulator, cyclic AMP receptor protein